MMKQVETCLFLQIKKKRTKKREAGRVTEGANRRTDGSIFNLPKMRMVRTPIVIDAKKTDNKVTPKTKTVTF